MGRRRPIEEAKRSQSGGALGGWSGRKGRASDLQLCFWASFCWGPICPVRWHPQDDGRWRGGGGSGGVAQDWRTTSSATSLAVAALHFHCRLKNNINKSQPGSSGHRLEVSTPWGHQVRGVPAKRKKECMNVKVKVSCFQVMLL